MATKVCKLCGLELSLTNYHKHPATKDRLQRICKKCTNITTHARFIRARYGISIEEFNALLVKQNFRCAICCVQPTKSRLSVDHDHKTGKIRGLLCHDCNRSLATLERCINWATSAQNYLKEYGE